MKILLVHNKYKFRGGEDSVVETMEQLLEGKGLSVHMMIKDSQDIKDLFFEKLRASISGLYCFSAARDMTHFIHRERPDLVHVHNVYPLFSPSILDACRRAAIPVVMTCHNYRLICPTGISLRNGQICELCLYGKEHWCVLKDCRNNIFESISYTIRNLVARKLRLFHNNVTLFIAPSKFARSRLINADLSEERIVVLPNMVTVPNTPADPQKGNYAAYVGRLSNEKGIDLLLASTKKLPEVNVRFAGDGPLKAHLLNENPVNATFVGTLNRPSMNEFYRKARFLILPSRCYEVCPLAISEAMSFGLPVIAARIGGIPELIVDGKSGFLFTPGDANELAKKINLLWENPVLCGQMGQAGREKAIFEFSEDVYYNRLLAIYEKAIEINRGKETCEKRIDNFHGDAYNN